MRCYPFNAAGLKIGIICFSISIVGSFQSKAIETSKNFVNGKWQYIYQETYSRTVNDFPFPPGCAPTDINESWNLSGDGFITHAMGNRAEGDLIGNVQYHFVSNGCGICHCNSFINSTVAKTGTGQLFVPVSVDSIEWQISPIVAGSSSISCTGDICNSYTASLKLPAITGLYVTTAHQNAINYTLGLYQVTAQYMVNSEGMPFARFDITGSGNSSPYESWSLSAHLTVSRLPQEASIDSVIDAGTGDKLVVKFLPHDPPEGWDYRVYLTDMPNGQSNEFIIPSSIIPESTEDKLQVVFEGLSGNTAYFTHIVEIDQLTEIEGPPIIPENDDSNFVSVPVFMVHGWNSNGGIWDTMKNWMWNELHINYRWAPNLEGQGVAYEDNFSGNATILGSFINDSLTALEERTGQIIDSINVVAHSMGGLISRRYISDGSINAGNPRVANLMMLGTPNEGVFIANLGCMIDYSWVDGGPLTQNNPIPAVCELGTEHINAFNSIFIDKSNTRYHAYAGTRGFVGCGCSQIPNLLCDVAWLTNILHVLGCPNDGLVSRRSAFGHYLPVPGNEGCFCHTELHSTYEIWSGFVKPILVSSQSRIKDYPLFAQSSSIDDQPPQISTTNCDVINIGTTKSDTIFGEGGQLTAVVISKDTMLTFSLEAPNGQVWDSVSAQSDTTIFWGSDQIIRSLTVSNADSGTWIVHIDANNLTTSTANYCLQLIVSNDLLMSTEINDPNPDPDDTIAITASIFDNGSPVIGAAVNALPVQNRSDTLGLIMLFDDGNHGDGAADDGIYSGLFLQSMDTGSVVFNLVATGMGINVGSFRREALLAAYISYPTWLCGDVNNDGAALNILDLTFMVDRIFRSGPPPSVLQAADLNGDGSSSNILDLTTLVDFIFRSGSRPTCGS